jgi:hypothetical protein
MILKALGLDPIFIDNVETLFVDASTCISINNCKFEKVCLFWLIRQAFPLDMTLYVLDYKSLSYTLCSKVELGLI